MNPSPAKPINPDTVSKPNRRVFAAMLLMALAVAVIAGSALAATSNLVKNGSFEKDTDGDGLDDAQEVKIYKTNPLSRNTDNDRYEDGQEIRLGLNPLVANSARINIKAENLRGEYNLGTIIELGLVAIPLGACAGVTLGACVSAIPVVAGLLNPILDHTVYSAKADITFINVGDDYTSYLSYDVVYYAGDQKIATVSQKFGKVDIRAGSTNTVSYDIKIRDIPGAIVNLVLRQATITAKVESVSYEYFG